MKLRAAIEEYLQAKRAANLSKQTIMQQRGQLARIAQAFASYGVEDLESVTPAVIQRYLGDRFEVGKAAGTVRSERETIMGFLNWCDRQDIRVDKRVFRNVGKVRVDQEEPRFLAPEEAVRLLQAAETMNFYYPHVYRRTIAILRLFLDTGMRRDELRLLDLSDLDMERRTVTIRKAKNRKSRTVFFGLQTAAALAEYLEVRNQRLDAVGNLVTDARADIEPALFIGRTNERISQTLLQAAIARVADKAGLEGVHAHTLRHTACTMMLRNGMPVQHVQRVMGHSKLDMTLHYVHILSEDTQEAYSEACPMDMLLRAG